MDLILTYWVYETNIYGMKTFEDYLSKLKKYSQVELSYFQSNIEGELIYHSRSGF